MPHAQNTIGANPTDHVAESPHDTADEALRCAGCGQAIPPDTSCEDCTACDRCHRVVACDDTIVTTRFSTICPSCRETRYWQCTGCDGWNRDDLRCANACDQDDDEDEEDEDYQDDEDVDSPAAGSALNTAILFYSYKPDPIFHGDGPLFLGPEVEIHTPYSDDEECAAIANAHLGTLGYLKSDDSIEPGFEIVTHPMSYPWAIKHFPWDMLTQLADAGAYTGDQTGLHVHLSRDGFAGPLHIYRWMKFVYRNQPQVTTLARRTSDYARFSDHDRRDVASRAKGGYGNRHTAINTNNQDTLELRIFASSLQPQLVQAAFGFAASSVEYTRDLDVPAIARHGGWSWPAYTAWLADRPAYAPLAQQLEALPCAC